MSIIPSGNINTRGVSRKKCMATHTCQQKYLSVKKHQQIPFTYAHLVIGVNFTHNVRYVNVSFAMRSNVLANCV